MIPIDNISRAAFDLEFDDRISKLKEWRHNMMMHYGWYVHFVFGDEDFPFGINFHTHGIEESFAHPDLQLCFPIKTEIAHQIFESIVCEIKKGIVFKANKKYADIIGKGSKIHFIPAQECNRSLLRIILSDENGQGIFPVRLAGQGGFLNLKNPQS